MNQDEGQDRKTVIDDSSWITKIQEGIDEQKAEVRERISKAKAVGNRDEEARLKEGLKALENCFKVIRPKKREFPFQSPKDFVVPDEESAADLGTEYIDFITMHIVAKSIDFIAVRMPIEAAYVVSSYLDSMNLRYEDSLWEANDWSQPWLNQNCYDVQLIYSKVIQEYFRKTEAEKPQESIVLSPKLVELQASFEDCHTWIHRLVAAIKQNNPETAKYWFETIQSSMSRIHPNMFEN